MTARELASDAEGAYRTGRRAAVGALLGVVVSGPIAVAIVNVTHPQPPWRDAESFARHVHPIQLLPYAGGLLLVAALVVLIASIHASARARDQALTGAALVATGAFAAFIFFNYVAQTTYLPDLARRYEPVNAPLIAALSMSNPRSLAWAIEMWGWGLFGVATWLVAPVFDRSKLERVAALTARANGVVSAAGALWTAARPGWVMTPPGLAAFAAWNVLLAALATLIFVAFGRRRADGFLLARRGSPGGKRRSGVARPKLD
ncbi:MAG TPA: hypothetical protein VHM31_11330 [Polyangia bacterium]|nr:hypothetical protein [Polyangia bacterium]